MLELKTYKNWNELCKSMNWATTGGNTKKKNLKLLDSICKYNKVGYSYVIEEIFEQPKEIIDNRGGKATSQLSNEIQFSILYLLSQEPNGNMLISKSKLLQMTGLINNQFNNINTNKLIYANNRDLNYYTVVKTLERTYTYVSQYLQRALKQLENKLLISVTKDIMYINIDDKITIEDKDTGNIKALKTININREATRQERKYILKIQKDVLKEYGYKSIDEVSYFKLNEINKKINNILKEKGINYYYYCYDIVGNDSYIKEEYEHLKEQMDNSKTLINNNMYNLINDSMIKKSNKFKSKSDILKDIIDKNNLDIENNENDKDKFFELIISNDIELITTKELKFNNYLLDENFKNDLKMTLDDSVKMSYKPINWNREFKKYENKTNKNIDDLFKDIDNN